MNVSELLVRLRLDNKQFKAGMKESTGLLQGVNREAGLLQKSMQLTALAGIGFMAKQAVTAVWDLGRLGAQAEQMGDSFQELARQAGGSGDAILAALKRATAGAVSDMDLIGAANKGILLGLGAQADQWEKLAEVARFRARAMGISMTQAIGDISMGIGRESRLILDNLGLILDIDKATSAYAATVGTTADKLTAFERKQAIMAAVIEEGQRQIQDAGGMIVTDAEKIERMDAALANLKERIGAEVAPAIAAVADATAEAIPTLITAVDQLSILANAGIEWAKAALEGADAERAFKMEVAERAGATEALAQMQREVTAEAYQTARMYVQVLEAERASLDDRNSVLRDAIDAELEAARAALAVARNELILARASEDVQPAIDGWRAAMLGAAKQAVEFGKASADARFGLGRLDAEFRRGTSRVTSFARALREAAGMVQASGLAATFEEVAAASTGMFTGLVGYTSIPDIERLQDEYVTGLQRLYTELQGMDERTVAYRVAEYNRGWEQMISDTRQAYDEMGNIMSDAAQDAQGYFDDIRSAVSGALQPTGVSELDWAATEAGEYVDKWDENRRRAMAIAARGFEELKLHPDWAAILKIPPGVLAGTEEQLKAWAGNLADAIGSLERPDLIDVDAAVAAVQAYLDREAAVELSLDLVTEAALKKGLVTGEDAKQQVAEALGLADKLPVDVGLNVTDEEKEAFMQRLAPMTVPVSLEPAVEGEAGGLGAADVAKALSEGLQKQISGDNWGAMITTQLERDLQAQVARLQRLGARAGGDFFGGFLGAIEGSEIVDRLVAEVLEHLTDAMGG